MNKYLLNIVDSDENFSATLDLALSQPSHVVFLFFSQNIATPDERRTSEKPSVGVLVENLRD